VSCVVPYLIEWFVGTHIHSSDGDWQTLHAFNGSPILFKLLFLALEANRDLRDRLGAVMSAEEVFQIGLETCEREEAAAREHPEEMNARCDIEGAPFT
jgi:hypothetical protein